jgi:hypothetical protein
MRRAAGGGAWAARLAALAVVGVLAALSAGLARGERVQHGNLIVSLDGGISPRGLPRDRPAPAAVSLSGRLRTADGSPLPRLSGIELALAGRGLLSTRGLPLCPRQRLRNATGAQALERCGGALVGHGRLQTEVFVPHQAPFAAHARLLAFNGRAKGGGVAVWVHAFSTKPPVSFVLPFLVRHRPGAFGTALRAILPRSIGPWPHLTSFEMTFGRRYRYRGALRSYLSASCPLPPRFTAGIFPFARATYTFAGKRRLATTIVRGCRARD